MFIERAGATIEVTLRYAGDGGAIRMSLGFKDLVILGAYILSIKPDLENVIKAVPTENTFEPITEE